jgi:hypothetical protein
MVTSRDEHLARIHADDNAKMADYRQYLEEAIGRAEEETFIVPLPDGPAGDPLLERVLEEYRGVGWTAKVEVLRDERYISFQ